MEECLHFVEVITKNANANVNVLIFQVKPGKRKMFWEISTFPRRAVWFLTQLNQVIGTAVSEQVVDEQTDVCKTTS